MVVGALVLLAAVVVCYIGSTIAVPSLTCVRDSNADWAAWRRGWDRSGPYMSAVGWLALGATIVFATGSCIARRRSLLVVVTLASLIAWAVLRFVVVDQFLHEVPCGGV